MRLLRRLLLIPAYEFVMQVVLGLPRFPPFLQMKRWLLRGLGARVGARVMIYPGVWIMPVSSKLAVGDDVDLAKDVLITTGGGVAIGDRTLVGYSTKILSSNHRVPEGHGRVFDAGHEAAQIRIENDVWIGANCVILPGVSIGSGAIIGAGAVVTKDVPKFTIAAGVPARVIRRRSTETRKR